MLPNFFIVGAPKAGTTSLYNYLRFHHDIFMSPIKEPNFFTHQEIAQNKLYYKQKNTKTLQDYERLFDRIKNQKICGEASVSYLFYPNTASKIRKLIPHAKIIILLRNPIDRAFSHYLMDKRLGYIHSSFESIIYRQCHHKLNSLYYQQYVELGFYYKQVKRYLVTFPAEQVKIFLSEDLVNFNRIMISILEFLNVEQQDLPIIEKRYNLAEMPESIWIKLLYRITLLRKCCNLILPVKWIQFIKTTLFNSEVKPEMQKSTRIYLYNLYGNDMRAVEKLIHRDLTIWH
jgi:hypothetical protein